MRQTVIVVLSLIIHATFSFAHPHFFKETMFRWEREDTPDARKVILRHITVPYNEIKAGNLPVGESWHCGFAHLETNTDLQSGKTRIPKGDYEVHAIRETEDSWSLELVTGEGDEKKTIRPEVRFKDNLPLESHLRFDLHPEGSKEDTILRVSIRFGTMEASFPVTPG